MDNRYIIRGSGKSEQIFIRKYEQTDNSCNCVRGRGGCIRGKRLGRFDCSINNHNHTPNYDYDFKPLPFSPNIYFDTFVCIMKNLFNYKELIGYESLIYVMYIKYDIKHKILYMENNNNQPNTPTFITSLKSIYDKDVIEYVETIPENSRMSTDYIAGKQICLLVDKNKNIMKIDVDSEFITKFSRFNSNGNNMYYDCVVRIPNSVDFVITIGEIVYYLDMMYNPQTNSLYTDSQDNAFPREYLSFISKQQPSFDDYVKLFYTESFNQIRYISKYVDDFIYYINNNKEDILRDAGIIITRTEFNYVSCKSARKAEINKKKEELIRQLQELDDEDSYD